jgi:hypothetical protein
MAIYFYTAIESFFRGLIFKQKEKNVVTDKNETKKNYFKML